MFGPARQSSPARLDLTVTFIAARAIVIPVTSNAIRLGIMLYSSQGEDVGHFMPSLLLTGKSAPHHCRDSINQTCCKIHTTE